MLPKGYAESSVDDLSRRFTDSVIRFGDDPVYVEGIDRHRNFIVSKVGERSSVSTLVSVDDKRLTIADLSKDVGYGMLDVEGEKHPYLFFGLRRLSDRASAGLNERNFTTGLFSPESSTFVIGPYPDTMYARLRAHAGRYGGSPVFPAMLSATLPYAWGSKKYPTLREQLDRGQTYGALSHDLWFKQDAFGETIISTISNIGAVAKYSNHSITLAKGKEWLNERVRHVLNER